MSFPTCSPASSFDRCSHYIYLCSLHWQTARGRTVKNVLQYDTNNPIECLDLHLKEITLNDYRGTPPEVKFAKFFVLNARALKVMRFDVNTEKVSWICTQHRRIRLEDKASAEAQFHFKDIGMNCVCMDNVHFIHNLSVADPFAKSMGWRSLYV